MNAWKTRTRIKLIAVMLVVIMILNVYCYVAQDFMQGMLELSDAYIKAKFSALQYINGGGLLATAATSLSVGVEKGMQKFKQGGD